MSVQSARTGLLATGLVAGLSACAVLLSQPALARPDTTRMSCAAARSLVEQAGAIVLSTGGSTFDRFVHHRGYCTPSEITQPAFVPARDEPYCFVGYTCEMSEGVPHDD